MKTNTLKYAIFCGFFVFLIACSTKRDSFLSRNSHALSTKYNILYNGGLALDAGVNDLKTTYADNYWERLSIERMQPTQEAMMPGEARNPNFERAETKAIKAIQKHSMNIDGGEKNPQMDEAHLMLGKARYYDQRFVPALEAFNYVLYKYPKSDKIYEVKIWREKTNMRMENDGLAVTNLRKLLKEIKFKDQIYADANATLAEAFLHLEEKDSAVAKLKIANQFTTLDEEKARYQFVLGQLYEELGYKDSAFAAFQSVIDMKRNSPRIYVIQAHARQAAQFDYKNGDTLAFVTNYNKLLEDRENRPYLAELNHQMALFYDKSKNFKRAEKYYNVSIKSNSRDTYLKASNYRNLADISFNDARYVRAGKYYDSTLVQLNPRIREYKQIQKKRENLVDVIKYEGIAQVNDSIINVFTMTDPQRTDYYETYIANLKKADELKKIEEEKAQKAAEIASANAGDQTAMNAKQQKANASRDNVMNEMSRKDAKASSSPNSGVGAPGAFYFYNQSTVAFGKNEFRKNWGNRAHVNNWRIAALSSGKQNNNNSDELASDSDGGNDVVGKKGDKIDERYTVDFYTSKLPTTQKEIDSLAKDRNFAYYQLGAIYKEKFREYNRAADKLERLLTLNPETRLILPSMYNLYKIYEIINPEKAIAMKNAIIADFPDSRYAQILSNSNAEASATLSPQAAYNSLFKRYEAGDYKVVLIDADIAINQYTGDEIVPKFELLKANTIGKLRGLTEFRKALNYVALTYPNSPEGKEAESLLATQITVLDNLQFSNSVTSNWKILYKSKSPDDKNTKVLQEKIKKFLADRKLGTITTSYDIYTETDNFVALHGLKSEEYAKGITSILKEFKEYKVTDVPIIISGQNYEIVQMKKNMDLYLTNPPMNVLSVTEQIPFTAPPPSTVQDPTKVQVTPAILQGKGQSQTPKATVPTQSPKSGGNKVNTGSNPSQPPTSKQLSKPGNMSVEPPKPKN